MRSRKYAAYRDIQSPRNIGKRAIGTQMRLHLSKMGLVFDPAALHIVINSIMDRSDDIIHEVAARGPAEAKSLLGELTYARAAFVPADVRPREPQVTYCTFPWWLSLGQACFGSVRSRIWALWTVCSSMRANWLAAAAAEVRGFCLLRENLSPSQRDEYAKHRYFHVMGGASGKRYRIVQGTSRNICELDEDGRCVDQLCFVPGSNLPTGDVMLAQKIALEIMEPHAVRIANKLRTSAKKLSVGAMTSPLI